MFVVLFVLSLGKRPDLILLRFNFGSFDLAEGLFVVRIIASLILFAHLGHDVALIVENLGVFELSNHLIFPVEDLVVLDIGHQDSLLVEKRCAKLKEIFLFWLCILYLLFLFFNNHFLFFVDDFRLDRRFFVDFLQFVLFVVFKALQRMTYVVQTRDLVLFNYYRLIDLVPAFVLAAPLRFVVALHHLLLVVVALVVDFRQV